MKLYNRLCIFTNVSIRRCRPRAWVPAQWVTLDWRGLKVQPACLVVPLGLVEVGEVDLCPYQSHHNTPRAPTTQVTCSRWGLLAWMIHQTPLEHVTPLQHWNIVMHCNIDWSDIDQLCFLLCISQVLLSPIYCGLNVWNLDFEWDRPGWGRIELFKPAHRSFRNFEQFRPSWGNPTECKELFCPYLDPTILTLLFLPPTRLFLP